MINSAYFRVIFIVIGVIAISLYVFIPSFGLALTGDDYLGLWRLFYHLEGRAGGDWNMLNYFFTDYGPQDIITFIIYKYTGLSGFWYYLWAYLLRLGAAISIFFLAKEITKETKIAIYSSILFIVTSTGLEVNDWSFNMPSFISIIFICVHLISLLRYVNRPTLKHGFLTLIIMILAIVSQPIRSSFLPLLTIFILFMGMIKEGKKFYLKNSLLIGSVLLAFYFLIVFSKIGVVFGIPIDTHDRFYLNWFSSDTRSFGVISELISKGDFSFILFFFGQIGSIIFPTKLVPFIVQIFTDQKQIIIYSSVIFGLVYLFELVLYQVTNLRNSIFVSRLTFLINIIWSLVCMFYFISINSYPMNSSEYFSVVLGGYFSIFVLSIIIQLSKQDQFHLLIFYVGLVFSFLPPWLRNPTFIHETTNRYLIVPSVFLVIILSLIINNFKSKCLGIFIFSFLIVLNIYTSHKYFERLSSVRSNDEVMSIREAIPFNNTFLEDETPMVYFFETDNPELLHHSIMFGFPAIISVQYDFDNPWHVAYTTNWKEVSDAYRDGSGLIRFGTIPINIVNIENIFSFKLESGKLIDTTELTRAKLKSESSLEDSQL